MVCSGRYVCVQQVINFRVLLLDKCKLNDNAFSKRKLVVSRSTSDSKWKQKMGKILLAYLCAIDAKFFTLSERILHLRNQLTIAISQRSGESLDFLLPHCLHSAEWANICAYELFIRRTSKESSLYVKPGIWRKMQNKDLTYSVKSMSQLYNDIFHLLIS